GRPASRLDNACSHALYALRMSSKETNELTQKEVSRPWTMIVSVCFAGAVLAGAAFATGSTVLAAISIVALVAILGWHARTCAAALVLFVVSGCSATITTAPPLRNLVVRPLGFKVRLANGDPGKLPASVAGAVDPSSDVVFGYDERATETHHELPAPVMVFV